MQHYQILEGRLLFIFSKFESILGDVMEIKVYEQTCTKNMIDYQTDKLINQFHFICQKFKIAPAITVEQNDKKYQTTLYSVIFQEESGTFTVALHFTKNQFMFTEMRDIPGITS